MQPHCQGTDHHKGVELTVSKRLSGLVLFECAQLSTFLRTAVRYLASAAVRAAHASRPLRYSCAHQRHPRHTCRAHRKRISARAPSCIVCVRVSVLVVHVGGVWVHVCGCVGGGAMVLPSGLDVHHHMETPSQHQHPPTRHHSHRRKKKKITKAIVTLLPSLFSLCPTRQLLRDQSTPA